MCKYGPYCGDGIMNGDEQCDLGSRENNKTYGQQDGCTPGCKRPHYCGDAVVDEAEGEQCDLGPQQRHDRPGLPGRLQGPRRLLT